MYFSMVSRKEKEVIMKKVIFKIAAELITIISVLFILWILVSWVDVVAHNDPVTGSVKYFRGNAIVLFAE